MQSQEINAPLFYPSSERIQGIFYAALERVSAGLRRSPSKVTSSSVTHLSAVFPLTVMLFPAPHSYFLRSFPKTNCARESCLRLYFLREIQDKTCHRTGIITIPILQTRNKFQSLETSLRHIAGKWQSKEWRPASFRAWVTNIAL